MRRTFMGLVVLAGCATRVDAPEPAAAESVPSGGSRSGSVVAPTAPLMRVTGAGERFAPLGVVRAEVHARVVGWVAESRVVMTFHNPHDRALTGELTFPLPAGATVSGYALDVDGQLVDAVAVEKDKARVVFEKEVRKGVDPGIVEWVGGNSFRTRVYPIPAGGIRTVAVRVVQRLSVDGSRAQFHWPLAFAAGLEALTVDVRIPNATGTPSVSWLGTPDLPLAGAGEQWEGSIQPKGQPVRGQLLVSLPVRGRAVAVETTEEGDTHFLIAEPTIDMATASPGKAAPVSRAVIYWDVSHSRRDAPHDRVLAGLAHYFAAVKQPEVAVDLVVFSNTIWWTRQLKLSQGDIAPLRQAVADLPYDGGTQLGAISPAPDAEAPDVYFVISDGLSNFGPAEPRGFAAPVHTISAGPVANAPFLRWMAQSTGGRHFNLAVQSPETMAVIAGPPPLAIQAIAVERGAVDEVWPRAGQPVGNQLWLTGKLLSPEAVLRVDLGVPGQVVASRRFTIRSDNAKPGLLLARLWAQEQVSRLAAFPKQNGSRLLALGRRYNLVTPRTSLIVLERLEQYLEHQIRPPNSLPKMRAAFDESSQQRRAEREEARRVKLDHIISLWRDRVKWWETRFRYPRGFRVRPQTQKKEVRGSNFGAAAPRVVHSPAPDNRSTLADEAPVPEEREVEDRPASPAPEKIEEKKDDAADSDGEPEPLIEVQPWDPDTPYLRQLKAAPARDAYAAYLVAKKTYATSPGFFLDCADFFWRQKKPDLALRVLSNVAELELEDAALMRVVAHRLAQVGELELARAVFATVLEWRPEEPQSYRDLALVLEQQRSFARAMELLAHVVMNQWDRFDEIELIALGELNHMIPRARAAGVKQIPLEPRLIKLLDVDIRISLSWDADLTDIDMWVIEPSGEKAYYDNNRTRIGGLVSRDFTQGYGPEEYVIRRAMPGTYEVKANFFGSSAQTLIGAVTIQLVLFTNYGRPNEQRESVTLRLDEAKDTITVGTLKFARSRRPE